ncbi:hypothetical protein BC936DRAFT_139906 [Jimgerdemannia flammicorona]|uniref:DNA/RNA-binding protein Alba-like domain-containing protein n=1 Tax=Jimgerdemannia flammicorona TaxID=994334 RepID=A0A433B947_9FUNG|nr:hypothetical protein BC936DRAFT_139906 [Jimgerdemannia flammicorona]
MQTEPENVSSDYLRKNHLSFAGMSIFRPSFEAHPTSTIRNPPTLHTTIVRNLGGCSLRLSNRLSQGYLKILQRRTDVGHSLNYFHSSKTAHYVPRLRTPWYNRRRQTMENYRRQPKSQEINQEHSLPAPADNEIRVTTQGKIKTYVSHGLALLQASLIYQDSRFHSIVLTGQGKAINKTVSVTEIIKRRLDGSLHQYTQVGNVKATDVWESVQRDLDKLVVTRHLPVITIHLATMVLPDLEKLSGYQPPTGKDIYQ